MKEERLTPAGSNRQYFRVTNDDGTTFIRVVGTSISENRAFVYLAQHFAKHGLPVPHIYHVREDMTGYEQEDLGNTLLFDAIAQGRKTGVFLEHETELLKHTIRLLPHFQIVGAQDLDWDQCYPVPKFDRRSVMWDLNYFKYNFLKLTGIDFAEEQLEDDFDSLSQSVLQSDTNTFLYRDFQSRNIMLRANTSTIEPVMIDFQGGRRGPIYYDLASFLWQAKANFSTDLRTILLNEYLDEARHIAPEIIPDDTVFFSTLPHFVLLRNLQVLGAYGFRGLFERKPHFLQSITQAVNNLRSLFANNAILRSTYPTLSLIAANPMLDKNSRSAHNTPQSAITLQVTVYSFSFKRGIPEDKSGNGGGYVFDCRSTHNPGKYEQYKHLTGVDQPVIDFLEKDGEILAFLDSVYRLIDHHVERFIERGFSHLQVAFGCTGGQHRSVYCAEHVAQYLRNKYDIKVNLIHREQPHIHHFEI